MSAFLPPLLTNIKQPHLNYCTLNGSLHLFSVISSTSIINFNTNNNNQHNAMQKCQVLSISSLTTHRKLPNLMPNNISHLIHQSLNSPDPQKCTSTTTTSSWYTYIHLSHHLYRSRAAVPHFQHVTAILCCKRPCLFTHLRHKMATTLVTRIQNAH